MIFKILINRIMALVILSFFTSVFYGILAQCSNLKAYFTATGGLSTPVFCPVLFDTDNFIQAQNYFRDLGDYNTGIGKVITHPYFINGSYKRTPDLSELQKGSNFLIARSEDMIARRKIIKL